MDKQKVKSIVVKTLESGTHTPGLMDTLTALEVKGEFEACNTIEDVLGCIRIYRGFLRRVFGLKDEQIDKAVKEIQSLA